VDNFNRTGFSTIFGCHYQSKRSCQRRVESKEALCVTERNKLLGIHERLKERASHKSKRNIWQEITKLIHELALHALPPKWCFSVIQECKTKISKHGAQQFQRFSSIAGRCNNKPTLTLC
jgi:hypothetical protein